MAARGLIFLFLLLPFTCFAGAAHSLEMEVVRTKVGTVLVLTGDIVSEDTEQLTRLLTSEIAEVHLDSMGGLLVAGIGIGKALRAHNAVTRIPTDAKCASACTYAFLGGRIRYVDTGGSIGVHMATLASNKEFRAEILKLLEEGTDIAVHVAISLIEQTAAFAAATTAEYLTKMGISLRLMTPTVNTDNWEMHWLSRDELRSWNVINVSD